MRKILGWFGRNDKSEFARRVKTAEKLFESYDDIAESLSILKSMEPENSLASDSLDLQMKALSFQLSELLTVLKFWRATVRVS